MGGRFFIFDQQALSRQKYGPKTNKRCITQKEAQPKTTNMDI